jgi:hypothetical protein
MGYIISVCLIFICIIGVDYGTKEYDFNQLPIHQVECQLISHSYSPNTSKIRIVPIFSSNGNYFTSVCTTGDYEKKITEWQCGEYGRLICDNVEIYRFAREESVLYIRSNSYDTRVVGIRIE